MLGVKNQTNKKALLTDRHKNESLKHYADQRSQTQEHTVCDSIYVKFWKKKINLW